LSEKSAGDAQSEEKYQTAGLKQKHRGRCLMETAIARIKREKRTIINQYAKADNVRGLSQAVTTLAPLAALWYAAVLSAGVSYWLTAGDDSFPRARLHDDA
jgi:hypothetical protein